MQAIVLQTHVQELTFQVACCVCSHHGVGAACRKVKRRSGEPLQTLSELATHGWHQCQHTQANLQSCVMQSALQSWCTRCQGGPGVRL